MTRPSRRDILSMAVAAPTLLLPATARAQALGATAAGNPQHFSFTLGAAKLTVVSDGWLETPAAHLGVNVDPRDVARFLQSYFLSVDTNVAHTNHLVIEIGEAVVLVDAGSGGRFMPTAGKLMGNLAAAGIDPQTITHVVITHAHPDHIWGVRDATGGAVLPQANHFVSGGEHQFWLQDGLAAGLSDDMKRIAEGAAEALQTDGIDWTLLHNDQEVVPGVRIIDTPGHTPGHISVVIESEGKQLIALGDAINHAYMNFAHPDWVNSFDMNPEATVDTRLRLLDMASRDRMAVLGYHFPFPGVGHVRKSGDAYQFIPALWQWTG